MGMVIDMRKSQPKTKDKNRQIQGAAAHAKGARFEARLERSFDFYRGTGAALICKSPEPMRPVRNLGNGKFEAFFVKKAQPDYEGTIKGGRTVIFEAKYTDTSKIEQSRVTTSQTDYINEKSSLGARCYVLAGFGSGAVYKIPWSIWSNMKAIFGRKYVTESDIAEYKVETATNGTLLLL